MNAQNLLGLAGIDGKYRVAISEEAFLSGSLPPECSTRGFEASLLDCRVSLSYSGIDAWAVLSGELDPDAQSAASLSTLRSIYEVSEEEIIRRALRLAVLLGS
jgi:hypothetical protein